MTAEDGNDFNFDEWIKRNNLTDIKHLFEKHNATNAASLQLTAEPLQSVMSDQEIFRQPQKIPIIMIALHNAERKTKKTYIVIYEEEDIVMNEMKQNISKLEEMEKEFKSLTQAISQSIQKKQNIIFSQIEATNDKINKMFDNIRSALQKEQNALLARLDAIKDDVNVEKKDNDDNKEDDILTISLQQLNRQKQEISFTLQRCMNIIESSDDKEKRQQNIKNVGKEANDKFIITKKELDQNTTILENIVTKNNECATKIDLIINEKTLHKILHKIQNVGNVHMYEPNDPISTAWTGDSDDLLIKKKREKCQALLNAMVENANNPHKWLDSEQNVNAKNQRAVTLETIYKAPMFSGHSIPYTVTLSSSSGTITNFEGLIHGNLDKYAATKKTQGNWIAASFEHQKRIGTMQMAGSSTLNALGVKYLNGKGRKLQYKDVDGNWVDVMNMWGFVQNEMATIQIGDKNITTNLIRIYTDQKCSTAIGCWRFFE